MARVLADMVKRGLRAAREAQASAAFALVALRARGREAQYRARRFVCGGTGRERAEQEQ